MKKIIFILLFPTMISAETIIPFNKAVNATKLNLEIYDSISKTIQKTIDSPDPDGYLSGDGDTGNIIFYETLSSADIEAVNTILTNHTTDYVYPPQTVLVSENMMFVTSSSHTITGLYKLAVTSQIVVGQNCLTIKEDKIYSSKLEGDVLSISTDAVTLGKKVNAPEMEIGSAGFKSNGRGKFKEVDIEVEGANRGLILTSTGTHKFLLWVDDNGNLFTTQIAASPEVSQEERNSRIQAKKNRWKELKALRKNTNSGNLSQRLDIIEEILNLK